MKTTSKAYADLLHESKRVGWPTRFVEDLTEWDRQALERFDAPKTFGWVLRDDGTHLVTPPRREYGRAKQLTARMVADAFGPENCRFYYFDGRRLIGCSTANHVDEYLKEDTEKLERDQRGAEHGR